MKIPVNFNEISKGFEPLPDGIYEAEVVEAKAGTSRAGFPKIDIRLKVVKGEYKNRSFFLGLSLQEQAYWKLQQFLTAINIDIKKGKQILDTEAWIGKRAMFTLRIDTENQRNNISAMFPIKEVSANAKNNSQESSESISDAEPVEDDHGDKDIEDLFKS